MQTGWRLNAVRQNNETRLSEYIYESWLRNHDTTSQTEVWFSNLTISRRFGVRFLLFSLCKMKYLFFPNHFVLNCT